MKILRVAKQAIPYSVDVRIAGETFKFTFDYNVEGDFFTVDLMRDDEVICLGEKIVYGKALFTSFLDHYFPLSPIVPIDRALKDTRVGWNELENTVFLYVLEG